MRDYIINLEIGKIMLLITCICLALSLFVEAVINGEPKLETFYMIFYVLAILLDKQIKILCGITLGITSVISIIFLIGFLYHKFYDSLEYNYVSLIGRMIYPVMTLCILSYCDIYVGSKKTKICIILCLLTIISITTFLLFRWETIFIAK